MRVARGDPFILRNTSASCLRKVRQNLINLFTGKRWSVIAHAQHRKTCHWIRYDSALSILASNRTPSQGALLGCIPKLSHKNILMRRIPLRLLSLVPELRSL